MNVLLIFAHPDPRSLNGALRDSAVGELKTQGHSVRVTDLYAEGWKAVVDRTDFPHLEPGARLRVPQASRDAFRQQALTPDVQAEQEKLLWADMVILQFPLWWFTMPAILKGWVDRVYAYGFGYGVGEHSDRRWGDRYGEGTMAGKRAMLIVTAGGWESHYRRSGVNGFMEDLLFPINHGILFYPGFEVLPPFVLYETDRCSEEKYRTAAEALRLRIRTLETTQPIPYRRQNGGDYDIPSMELRADLDRPEMSPFALHLNQTESHERLGSNGTD